MTISSAPSFWLHLQNEYAHVHISWALLHTCSILLQDRLFSSPSRPHRSKACARLHKRIWLWHSCCPHLSIAIRYSRYVSCEIISLGWFFSGHYDLVALTYPWWLAASPQYCFLLFLFSRICCSFTSQHCLIALKVIHSYLLSFCSHSRRPSCRCPSHVPSSWLSH